MTMRAISIIFSFFYCFGLFSQFYNKDIGFLYIGIDTSYNELNFVCKPENNTNPYYCIFYEELVYNKGAIISEYCEEDEKVDNKIELIKTNDFDKVFNDLYLELEKDTYLFDLPYNSNYAIYYVNNNQYLLTYFESNNFEKQKCNKVISFNKILLDNDTPLLIAYISRESSEFVIALYDKNNKFYLLDRNGFQGVSQNKRHINLIENQNIETVNKWYQDNDTTRYTYFNGQTLAFSKDEYNEELIIELDSDLSIEYSNNVKKKGNYDTNFKISDIKKYKKGELLKSVNGKVFDKGSIKFINENGGALFVNHNVEYQNTFISYFKEIQLIEDITILTNEDYHLIPFENHFKLISKEGEIYKNINYDFKLGNEYKRRILAFKEDIEIYKYKDKFGIKDNYNQGILLQPIYDSIIISKDYSISFIIAKRKNEYEIFNTMFEKIYSSNKILDFYISSQFIQIIEKGKNFYLTSDGELNETMPKFGYIGCGFDGMHSVEKKLIVEDSINSFLFYKNTFISFDIEVDNENEPSMVFKGRYSADSDSINFINGRKYFLLHSYDNILGSDYFDNEVAEYILSYKRSKISLIKIGIKKDEKLFYEIDKLIADEVKYIDNSQPLYYRKGNLWGCYILNKEPKYSSIEPFNGQYGRIVNAKGKKGWINKIGQEFWEK